MSHAFTPLDHSLIEGRINQAMKLNEIDDPSLAFIYAMLDKIYPNISDDISDIITDGARDRGVDAIYIRERDDITYVDILNFKYRTTPKNCDRNFEENEIIKIFAFVTDILNKCPELIKNSNKNLRNRINDIYSIVSSGRICYFKIILCSNGRPLTPDALERLEQFCRTHHYLDYEQIDRHGTLNLLLQSERPQECAKLNVVDHQIFDRSDGDIRGTVASIEINSFLDSIVDTATKSIKRYLFDDNIRVYLGDDGGHNKEIISSSLSNQNHLFWYCNNGITIICDSFEYQKGMRNPIITIKNFQIVNGAQTCHALLRAREQDRSKVSSVLLLCRIYETKRRDVSQKVAIATNSQARINLRDLHSNDLIQVKIEKFFLDSGFYYERKKNQYADKPNSKRIDALKLGQILLAYKLREPERAKKESDDIFGSRYRFIFSEDLTSAEITNIVKLFQYMDSNRELKIVQHVRQANQKRYADIMSYGFWHVLFMISLMCERDGKQFPLPDEFDKYIKDAVIFIDNEISKYKTVSNYDMFRNVRIRTHLQEEFDGPQLHLDL